MNKEIERKDNYKDIFDKEIIPEGWSKFDMDIVEKCPKCGELSCYFPYRVQFKLCPKCGCTKDGEVVELKYTRFDIMNGLEEYKLEATK